MPGPKNKVGQWVAGGDFWNRETELATLSRYLYDGDSVLLVAPRRVGKTSLVRETLSRIEANGQQHCLFVDIEDASSAEDVVVALALAATQHRDLRSGALEALIPEMSGNQDLSVDLTLLLRASVAGDWITKGSRLIERLAQAQRPTVVCLDELPVMLNRLLTSAGTSVTTDGRVQGERFLSWLRRQAQTQPRFRTVICGSIGLEPIVHMAGLSHTIGHLHTMRLDVWSTSTAQEFLAALADEYSVGLGDAARDRMLDLLGWCVPHHVQMFFGHILDECNRLQRRAVDVPLVETIYSRDMLGIRGHAELADYEERLLRVLGHDFKPLALALLTEASVRTPLRVDTRRAVAAEILPPGVERNDALRLVMDVLVHDGYLRETPSGSGEYLFVSALIAEWWKRRHGTGYERRV